MGMERRRDHHRPIRRPLAGGRFRRLFDRSGSPAALARPCPPLLARRPRPPSQPSMHKWSCFTPAAHHAHNAILIFFQLILALPPSTTDTSFRNWPVVLPIPSAKMDVPCSFPSDSGTVRGADRTARMFFLIQSTLLLIIPR